MSVELAEARVRIIEARFYRDFDRSHVPDTLIGELKRDLDCFRKYNVYIYEVTCMELIGDLYVQNELSHSEADRYWSEALVRAQALGDTAKVNELEKKRLLASCFIRLPSQRAAPND